MKKSLLTSMIACGLGWSQTIQAPAGFSPDNNLMLGLSNDLVNSQSLASAQKQFPVMNHFRVITSRDSLNQDLTKILSGFAQQSDANLRPSFILSFFDDTTRDVNVLLNQMNDPVVMRTIFQKIKEFGDELTYVSQDQQKPFTTTVFVEPNVWARILQARFHFENDPIPRQPDLTFGNVIYAGALVKANSLGLGPEFQFLDLYDNNVGDLGRALIHAVKNFFPSATTLPAGQQTFVGIPLNFWAAYAKGCGKAGAIKEINEKVRNNPLITQGEEGIQTWDPEDIKIAAYANVHFFRKVFDSTQSGAARIGAPALAKPDFYGMQRSPVDAGFTLFLDSLNPAIEMINGPTAQGGLGWKDKNQAGSTKENFPAHGKPSFYWNQAQWDKWLSFSEIFAQGMKTPLIALRMPVGHLGLSNKIFAWEDTFYDWLFSNPSTKGNLCLSADGLTRQGECAWAPDNFKRFKDAGFVGVWAGRDGWPDLTTHYGTMQKNYFMGATDASLLQNNRYFKNLETMGLADANLSLAGDGGLFVNSLASQVRTLAPVTVKFNEGDLNKYAGNCSAPSTPQLGVVELRGSKVIDGKASDIYEISSVDHVQVPEIVKQRAIATFAQIGAGDLRYLDGSKAEGDEIANYFKNESGVQLHINLRYPNVFDPETGKVLQDKLLPLSFRWFIFDTQGQYVNSQTGVISPAELKDYIVADTTGGANSGQVDLVGYFNMRSDKGRKLAAGTYIWKGYIDEQTAQVFTGQVNSAGQRFYETVTSENQTVFKKFGVIRK